MAIDQTSPNAIEVEGLVRVFKKGPRAVDGIDLRGRAGRDLRLPRPERRRQVDHRADADDAAAADGGDRAGGAASTSSSEGPRVRRTIGAALQEAALDPYLTGPRAHAPADRPPRARQGRARARGNELLERVGLAEAADRRVRRLLGRDEAPPRPRPRARPQPAHPVPRRADHRPRPPEPHRALGGGGAPRREDGRDRLPHHPVPRGGRRCSPTASGSSTTARSSPRARPLS